MQNTVTHVQYGSCRSCGGSKPNTGLGSDGRCLDCRLEPIRASQPRLSSTQRKRKNGHPTAYYGEHGDD
jgi:hypothetical protein